jgi:glycosyltransferase involved in cell wall biosynthesis
MACETPVIAVKEGGYLEIVEEGKNGFFVGRNPTQIARKIEYLINNPQKAASMGKEGRKGVITKWNWERHGRNLERIILGNIRKTRVLISGKILGVVAVQKTMPFFGKEV